MSTMWYFLLAIPITIVLFFFLFGEGSQRSFREVPNCGCWAFIVTYLCTLTAIFAIESYIGAKPVPGLEVIRFTTKNWSSSEGVEFVYLVDGRLEFKATLNHQQNASDIPSSVAEIYYDFNPPLDAITRQCTLRLLPNPQGNAESLVDWIAEVSLISPDGGESSSGVIILDGKEKTIQVIPSIPTIQRVRIRVMNPKPEPMEGAIRVSFPIEYYIPWKVTESP